VKTKLFATLTATLAATLIGCTPTIDAPNNEDVPTWEPIPVVGVVLVPVSTILSVGKTLQLKCTIVPAMATNQAVTWKSDNTFVATVDNNGLVTASGFGTATIEVTTDDGNKKATCVVSTFLGDALADGDWYAYQTHSTGPGIDLVFMGDGYIAIDIESGKYERDMHTAIEGFFGLEPYKSYRNYFNAYIVMAESVVRGVGTNGTANNTKFGVFHGSGTQMTMGSYTPCFTYTQKAPISNLENTLTVLVAHSTKWGGTCHWWSSGRAIAIQPSDYGAPLVLQHLVQHEAGGHGFAKLADEYIDLVAAAGRNRSDIPEKHKDGWYTNVDITNDKAKVIWKDFIGHPKYPMVGTYQGGYYFMTGVWRPENSSAMGNTSSTITRPYNAPSRAAIVKRIKQLADEVFVLEEFINNDAIVSPVETKAFDVDSVLPPLSPPICVVD
jgi:hypothetical protein